jgi:antitoxin (DNA-binding transcriptional repressor) of toxin-antitoxin stability system
MIRAVRAGASYDLTERGLPIARIIPYAESRWVPSDEANAVLAAGGNPVWLAELLADRAAEPGEDPWRIE